MYIRHSHTLSHGGSQLRRKSKESYIYIIWHSHKHKLFMLLLLWLMNNKLIINAVTNEKKVSVVSHLLSWQTLSRKSIKDRKEKGKGKKGMLGFYHLFSGLNMVVNTVVWLQWSEYGGLNIMVYSQWSENNGLNTAVWIRWSEYGGLNTWSEYSSLNTVVWIWCLNIVVWIRWS